MQAYLQPRTLRENLVEQFDCWAGNFGETVTAMELSADGQGYKMNTRFARFVNLPELMTMFREVADIRTAEMLKLPVPKRHMEVIVAPVSEPLKRIVAELVERAARVRGSSRGRKDNMLAVTTAGRKAALDVRLVDPTAPDLPQGKINLCVEKVFEIWQKTTPFRGTQVIFCDLGTPNKEGRFDVYGAIRAKLLERGIPAEQIAFVQDYDSDTAKARLFREMREGSIRVLLASTQKGGVGTNIQTRLYALHQLDAPWRPADVEQREGRIVRQGNLNEEVYIYRYVAEGSFDAYIWQTLEIKARFIAQVMRGDTSIRTIEDIELAAMTYAEMKALASGNPLVLEKATVDTEIAKLSMLRTSWFDQQCENQSKAAWLPKSIETTLREIDDFAMDSREQIDVRGDRFVIDLEGVTFTERTAAGKRLFQYCTEAVRKSSESGHVRFDALIGRFAGFDLKMQVSSQPHFWLSKRRRYSAGFFETELGVVRAIEHAARQPNECLTGAQARLVSEQSQLADILEQLDKPFPHEARLKELTARQFEIAALLDLDKNAEGAADADAEQGQDAGEDEEEADLA